MRKLLPILLGTLLLPAIAFAAPVSWDFTSSVLQPLQSGWGSLIKGNRFQATSTSAASIFPYASTTAISSSILTNGNCVQAGTGGLLTTSSSPCGNGTIGSGTQGQFPFYNAAGTTLTATSSLFVSQQGFIGVSSTTPSGLLSLSGVSTQSSTTPLFAVGSSTPLVGGSYISISGNGTLNVSGRSIDPVVVGYTQGPVPGTTIDQPNDVWVSGKYAYVVSRLADSLTTFDVSNPSNPLYVSTYQGPVPGTSLDGANFIAVSGNYAYITNHTGNSLAVVDISNPISPRWASLYTGPVANATIFSNASGIVISGKYAYITNAGNGKLIVVDISNPTNLQLVANVAVPGALELNTGMYISGNYLYFTDELADTLDIYDISNPSNPLFIVAYGGLTPGSSLDFAHSVWISGKYAYVVSQTAATLAIIDVSNPASPSWVTSTGGPVPGTSLLGANQVWLSGRYAYITSVNSARFSVIDITIPTSPVWVAETLGSPGRTLTGARNMFVVGNYAYVVSLADDSLAVIDIGGATISNLYAGTLQSDTLQVNGPAYFNNNLNVRGGIQSGQGIFSNGGGSFSVASTSSLANSTALLGGIFDNNLNTTENAITAFRGAYSGTPAAGLGAGLAFQIALDSGPATTTGQIASVLTSAASTSPSAYLTFSVKNGVGSLTEAMRILSSGNIGVGTPTPTDVNANARLTVAGIGSQDIIASTTDNTTLSDAIFNAYAPGSRIFLGAHGTNQVTNVYGITVGGWGEIGALNSTSGSSNGLLIGTRTTATPVVFGTNGGERMRILSNGNVGIGTTTPYALFSLNGYSAGTVPLFAIATSSASATSTTLSVSSVGDLSTLGEISIVDTTLTNAANGSLTTTMTFPGAAGAASRTGIMGSVTYTGATGSNRIKGMVITSAYRGTVNNTVTNSAQNPGGVSGATYVSQNDTTGLNVLNQVALNTVIQLNQLVGTAASTTNAVNLAIQSPGGNSASSVITNFFGVQTVNTAPTGVVTNYTAFNGVDITYATNYTTLLIGTSTAPVGNYGIYQFTANKNYFAGNTGIGTTTPFALLSVAGSSNGYAFAVSTTTGSSAPNFAIDSKGHVVTSGVNPTCDANCTFLEGNDNAFRVLTGTIKTSMTITFANSWGTKAPICISNEGGAGTVAVNASSTPTTVVLTALSALTGADVDVRCIGIQ